MGDGDCVVDGYRFCLEQCRRDVVGRGGRCFDIVWSEGKIIVGWGVFVCIG